MNESIKTPDFSIEIGKVCRIVVMFGENEGDYYAYYILRDKHMRTDEIIDLLAEGNLAFKSMFYCKSGNDWNSAQRSADVLCEKLRVQGGLTRGNCEKAEIEVKERLEIAKTHCLNILSQLGRLHRLCNNPSHFVTKQEARELTAFIGKYTENLDEIKTKNWVTKYILKVLPGLAILNINNRIKD